MKILKRLFLLLLISAVILFSLLVGYYLATTKDVSLVPEKLTLADNHLLVYDCNGEPIDNVSAFSIKQTTKLEDIPKHTQLAFVSIEDKRFYKHHGFDVRRIAKAALNNLKSRSFKEGASTISQQLVKNTHLTQEKTIKRKLQEWKLTNALEKRYSKEEILEKYLNSIYFGHNCFGITAAADFYFGKTPQELDLADSAILAGLVKSPNHYSPFKNVENCQRRKESVLSAMVRNGYVTSGDKEQALNKPLPLPTEHSSKNVGYLSFVFDELSAVAEELHLTLGGKIEIHTGLEPTLQAQLEGLTEEACNCDKTAMVLDTPTGNFKACVSSVGNICRLPGSLIKPLLVYTPALEENLLSPATPILDESVNYSGYQPENFDGKYHGYQSARECVSKSLNIPAVKVLQSLGISKAAGYLEKLGLPVDKEDYSLALALGGMKKGFPLRELCGGYLTLANGGVYRDCGFISEIKLQDHTVYKRPDRQTQVFSEDSAYLMTDMLKSTTKIGTAKKLHSLPFDVAAKTGTVGTKNGNTDAYALSYTTRDLVAVWLGNADNTVIPHTGGGLPCNYLLKINEYLYGRYQREGNPPPNFTMPNTVQRKTIDKLVYYDTHNIQLADELSPAEYTFDELFKTAALPAKKSDYFSNPRIPTPSIAIAGNQVQIRFGENAPTFYRYKIDRYDYATHTTVYEGATIPLFVDDGIESAKSYIYTVIPLYNGREGIHVTLPAVSVQAPSENQEPSIVDKDWWKY